MYDYDYDYEFKQRDTTVAVNSKRRVFAKIKNLKNKIINTGTRNIQFSVEVIKDYISFTCVRSVIGPETLRHNLNQSDLKSKPNQSRFRNSRFPAL